MKATTRKKPQANHKLFQVRIFYLASEWTRVYSESYTNNQNDAYKAAVRWAKDIQAAEWEDGSNLPAIVQVVEMRVEVRRTLLVQKDTITEIAMPKTVIADSRNCITDDNQK